MAVIGLSTRNLPVIIGSEREGSVTVMQLNGSDLGVGLLSLDCQPQPYTRRSTQVFCPVAVTLNQQSTFVVGYYRK